MHQYLNINAIMKEKSPTEKILARPLPDIDEILEDMFSFDPVSTGNKFRTIRKMSGLTQEEAGKIVGVSKNSILNFEKGKHMLNMRGTVALINYYSLRMAGPLSYRYFFDSRKTEYSHKEIDHIKYLAQQYNGSGNIILTYRKAYNDINGLLIVHKRVFEEYERMTNVNFLSILDKIASGGFFSSEENKKIDDFLKHYQRDKANDFAPPIK